MAERGVVLRLKYLKHALVRHLPSLHYDLLSICPHALIALKDSMITVRRLKIIETLLKCDFYDKSRHEVRCTDVLPKLLNDRFPANFAFKAVEELCLITPSNLYPFKQFYTNN
uniref:Uncharacterized protein n=1 Tax=Panagrolaimus sp. JU765 TaxID=591449 RepID=A0AC34QZF4_9BILA